MCPRSVSVSRCNYVGVCCGEAHNVCVEIMQSHFYLPVKLLLCHYYNLNANIYLCGRHKRMFNRYEFMPGKWLWVVSALKQIYVIRYARSYAWKCRWRVQNFYAYCRKLQKFRSLCITLVQVVGTSHIRCHSHAGNGRGSGM